MQAIVADGPGGSEVLSLVTAPDPECGPRDVLIEVNATAVNRADLLQRAGAYPPPPGASAILGLEASGVIASVGAEVTGWRVGDRVCALVAGGAYAELLAAPAGQVFAAPPGMDLRQAAALPEAFVTAHDNLFTRARLRPAETVLVQGGAGGVGTAAIQLAHRHGCRVLTTARSADRIERCLELGADAGINHRTEDVVARVGELTGGEGVDVVLDVMGASHLERNMDVLADDGRLVVIGLQGGTRTEVDLNVLLRRRLTIIATVLRSRPPEQKALIVARLTAEVLPGFADGTLHPVVDRVMPLAEAAEAHRLLEAGAPIGKIVLEVIP